MAFFNKRMEPWKLKLIAWLVARSTDLLAMTWRVRFIGRNYVDELTQKGKPFVLVFWHGDMLMGWYFHRNRRYSSLVSMSRDGDLLTEILRQWRFTVIRGSSSKGSAEAKTQMEQIIRNGKTLVVTPDGPRGPVYEMKMGALRTAQKTGVPLVSVTFSWSRAYRMKSWDRFTVPKPFSKIIVRYRAPELIDPDLHGEALNEIREDFEKGMKPGLIGV
jgi:lysophospholipid acyltransferase (LPLAT)-like uncharacterized protein